MAHLKTSHNEIISDEQLHMVADTCKKSDPTNIVACPLCSWVQEQALRAHLSETHGYSLGFEDFSYWECLACRVAQRFDTEEDLQKHRKEFHDGSILDSTTPSSFDTNATQKWECKPCREAQIFGSEEDLESHVAANHPDISLTDRLPDFLDVCAARYPHYSQICPICSSPLGDWPLPETNSVLDHIAEHIHSFSLYSLPWAGGNSGEEISGELYFPTDEYFADDDEDSNRAWNGGEDENDGGDKPEDDFLESLRKKQLTLGTDANEHTGPPEKLIIGFNFGSTYSGYSHRFFGPFFSISYLFAAPVGRTANTYN